MNTLSEVIYFPVNRRIDKRGALSVIEGTKDVPFAIGRLFYVTGVEAGETRGRHSHQTCKQALICIQGSCEVICDDGRQKKSMFLDSTTGGLYLPPGIWAEQKYIEKGTVLLVLADQHYDESDYVRDHPTFLAMKEMQ